MTDQGKAQHTMVDCAGGCRRGVRPCKAPMVVWDGKRDGYYCHDCAAAILDAGFRELERMAAELKAKKESK